MSVLKTDKLSVGYNKKVLIKDIDISIEKGEILTLIGPNGAGKSTILKTIARQLESVGGNVYFDDNDYTKIGGNELAKKVAVMFTGKIKGEMLNCEDIVATGRYPYTGHFGLLSKEDKEEVKKAMELVNISDIKDSDFSKISDGQRQRVMLARAVCQDTDIIFSDINESYPVTQLIHMLIIDIKVNNITPGNFNIIISLCHKHFSFSFTFFSCH